MSEQKMVPREEWTRVGDKHPPPHARYQVKNGVIMFLATPCYGMHAPWWVPFIDGAERPPMDMRDGDEWRPAAPAAPPAPAADIADSVRKLRDVGLVLSGLERIGIADALTALLRERDALRACVEAADALGNADRVKCRECGMYQIDGCDFDGYDAARAALKDKP